MDRSFDDRWSRARSFQQHKRLDLCLVGTGELDGVRRNNFLVPGINKLIEARYLSQELKLAAADATFGKQEIRKSEPASLPEVPNTNELAQPGSVTERTTELLNR
ncbi:MAG: hypothetical protein M3447_08755 [Acidobacteriota bacterium]|nr:hypothetical protein [Acidobacteriota bacterium]